MKIDKVLKTILILGLVINHISCSTDKDEYILDENFDSNELGWVEERTDFHYLDIRDGEYFIHSIDTSASRSSSGSLAGNYLYDLPKQYEIATSIKLSEKIKNNTHFGILLYSPTLEHNFAVFSDGEIVVTEYDFNKDSSNELLSKKIELSLSDPTNIIIKIKEMEFELVINNKTIGTGNFKTETNSWYDLRLYTSVESSILVDYLRIKEK